MTCSKCGRAVYGQRTRRGNHPICSRRRLKRGERKRRRIALIAHKGWNMAATTDRRFQDPKSRVMRDGREILFGLDWRDRVQECFRRDKGVCHTLIGEVGGVELICGRPAVDVDHYPVKRSQGRDDRLSNLVSRCRKCHEERHPEKQTRFAEIRKGKA